MDQPRYRVLIIGGYGQFGRRVAQALADDCRFTLIISGRSGPPAEAFAASLRRGTAATVESASIDVDADLLAGDIATLRPDVVIHTAGPFQRRDYRVAEAALECGAHYVDLADGREFVVAIDRLDAAARHAGRWVISGASSVPGLSVAVVDAFRDRFADLHSVSSMISPGNRTPRGLATTRAILGYVGRPMPALIDGRRSMVHGWQSLRRLRLAGIGTRWFARCDVPDLELMPSRYPTLRCCEFRAGLELRRMHFGLWIASAFVRAGLCRSLDAWAPALLEISQRWIAHGSDIGIMQVELAGNAADGGALNLRWRLVAREGSGPQIPATAAVVLARKLAAGTLPGSGARACVGLFTLDEFLVELSGLPIDVSLQVTG